MSTITHDEFAADHSVSAPLIDNGVGDGSLQVPYDRIKSPGAVRDFDSIVVDWQLQMRGSNPVASIAANRSFFIAACFTIFYRYTGQSDIPLWVNLLGRETILSNHALRSRVSGKTCFSALELGIREELADGQSPDDSFGPVAITIADGGVACLAQNAQTDILGAIRPGDDSPDLHFLFNQYPDRVRLDVGFDQGLFDRQTIERLANHLLRVMTVAAASPDTRLAEFELLSPGELAVLNRTCIGTAQQFPNEPAFREFEKCARKRGKEIAIQFNAAQLNYADANARVNQIAAHLIELGVEPTFPVVVCLEPCLELPLILLALFKVGAVYVPVNPEYPQARIDAIVEDTRPAMVVTQSHIARKVRFETRPVLEIDSAATLISKQPDENPNVLVGMQQIAYIYYTSGTTGRPKGVTGSHANLVQMLHSSRLRYGIGETVTIPAVASFTFSISMFELMAPLTVGGTLRILERRQILSAEAMSQILPTVTLFHIGPSLLKNIVRYIKHNVTDWSCYRHVRHASSGGDMVPPELLNDLRAIFSAAEIFVIYGCSEISLMGCTYQVPDEDILRTYVGWPFANVRLLVLDDDNNQVPIGAVGDVCFGGPGVVPGYLNRRELVKELFFEMDGVHYYRTGDRGRLSSSGYLELLGRRDFQVQIRGMRVEIGEIEYHLRQAPGVRDGVVAASASASGETTLVAYYLSDCSDQITSDPIRKYMASQLPEYMVPVKYVHLDALPLNQNLKIDRKALPSQGRQARTDDGKTHDPRTTTETALAAIWIELLRVDAVNLDDNFLLLGGDSILAMEMIFLVHQRLQVKLDGMDVLRESLQVLADICDRALQPESAAASAAFASKTLLRKIAPLESFFFGPADSLYGVYSPTQRDISKTPVLVCGPCAHESVRCSFFLKLLAEALAAAGTPVLRFNYFGCDDSLGDNREAGLQRWREDIQTATRWLQQRTDTPHINVLGIRLGATLAAQALTGDELHWLLAWDPVIDGIAHVAEQRRMHLEKIQKLLVIRRLRQPKSIVGFEELIGFTWANDMIEELRRISWRTPSARPVSLMLSKATAGLAPQMTEALIEKLAEKVTRLSVDCGWYDSTRVTAAITSKLISNQLFNSLKGQSVD